MKSWMVEKKVMNKKKLCVLLVTFGVVVCGILVYVLIRSNHKPFSNLDDNQKQSEEIGGDESPVYEDENKIGIEDAGEVIVRPAQNTDKKDNTKSSGNSKKNNKNEQTENEKPYQKDEQQTETDEIPKKDEQPEDDTGVSDDDGVVELPFVPIG